MRAFLRYLKDPVSHVAVCGPAVLLADTEPPCLDFHDGHVCCRPATLSQVWSGMGDWSLGFPPQLIIVIKLFKEAYYNNLLLQDVKDWAEGKLNW